MQKKKTRKSAKAMKNRITITFEPDPDVLKQLLDADSRGRGVRSRLINQAIRERLTDALRRWDAFVTPPENVTGGTR